MSERINRDNSLQFRFSRLGDETPAVPASVLIQTLEGAQRAIWLIALANENKDVKSRARIPSDIEQRYQLKCEVPEAGSYLLPTYVESVQPKLATMDQVARVLGKFESVAFALSQEDRNSVGTLLPDSAIRRRVVDAFQLLAPKPGSGWRLDLANHGTVVRLEDSWQSSIRRMYTLSETEPDRETINGELIEINFADRQITIVPVGSHRRLQMTYPEDLEDLLLENRRALIQVTGRVLRGEDEEVKKIFDLESIGPLDLSPLEISEVEHRGVRLRLREPLHLQPRLGVENPHFVTVEESRLGLDAFAGTVSELVDEVAESLVMGWRNYAQAADEELSPKALDLKRSLLASKDEVPVGG